MADAITSLLFMYVGFVALNPWTWHLTRRGGMNVDRLIGFFRQLCFISLIDFILGPGNRCNWFLFAIPRIYIGIACYMYDTRVTTLVKKIKEGEE